jgi:hypothetical protein
MQRRLEAMRRDLHDLKRKVRLSTQDLRPESVIALIDEVIQADRDRIGRQA